MASLVNLYLAPTPGGDYGVVMPTWMIYVAGFCYFYRFFVLEYGPEQLFRLGACFFTCFSQLVVFLWLDAL